MKHNFAEDGDPLVAPRQDAALPGSLSPPQGAPLGAILDAFGSTSIKHDGASCGATYENRLVDARLGIASGLFSALKHKHPATAAHSLRVALGCSSWAFALGLSDELRDELEIS